MSKHTKTPTWLASAQRDFIGSHQPYTRRIAELERQVEWLEAESSVVKLVERVKELEAQNITFRNAQKACEDCMTPTYAALRTRVSDLEKDRDAAVKALAPFASCAMHVTSFGNVPASSVYLWKPSDNTRELPGISAQHILDAATIYAARAKEDAT